jgi:hypothetical protein
VQGCDAVSRDRGISRAATAPGLERELERKLEREGKWRFDVGAMEQRAALRLVGAKNGDPVMTQPPDHVEVDHEGDAAKIEARGTSDASAPRVRSDARLNRQLTEATARAHLLFLPCRTSSASDRFRSRVRVVPIEEAPMEFVPSIVSYLLSEATPYLVFAGGGYLAWRFVRAYERRSVSPDRLDAITDRVRLLEDAMDHLEDRVERCDEVQRFTTRVLAGHVTNATHELTRAR